MREWLEKELENARHKWLVWEERKQKTDDPSWKSTCARQADFWTTRLETLSEVYKRLLAED